MRITEIAFVSYPVTDLKRARQFYEGVLGLKETHFFSDKMMRWVEYDIGPGTLAIGAGVPDWKPSPDGGCAALEVDDFDAAVKRLKENACKLKVEPLETGVCHMAIVSDPDGNSLIIHKRKAG